MGFWDTIKSAAISAKCLTGWHAGNYKPIEGKPQCNVEKTCPDCNKYVTAIKHKFNDWQYINSTSSHRCDSFRSCVHCDAQETKRIHKFEERGKDSSCRVIEKCSNCFEERSGGTTHNWAQIMGRELKVQGKRKCQDCGIIEE
tara:strand:+ start:1461 stop:1889 length:429 start_codon:yes stop_codon:yes gene_type:complete